ncbi:MAG: hypothetical protein KAS16_06540 [Thermoplasmata archaeon]|nr:hypothetical protein [Thermoplasmata archaeon]
MNERSSSRIRKFCWAFIISIFLVTMTFSIMTMDNYTQIAKAKHLTTVELDMEPEIFYVDDNQDDIDHVTVLASFTISNPSNMRLSIWTLSCLVYLRDLPAENGLNASRASRDLTIKTSDGVQYYYGALKAYEFYTDKVIHIEPNSNVTEYLMLEVGLGDRDVNDDRTLMVLNDIHDHSSENDLELEWYGYARLIIFIDDIPKEYGALSDSHVIIREARWWSL